MARPSIFKLLPHLLVAIGLICTPQAEAVARKKSSAKTTNADLANANVGLVVSGDTSQSVEDLQKRIVQGNEIIIPNQAMIQDLDPVYMHARLLAALKTRYPSIKLQPDLKASMRARNALTVVVDVHTALGASSGDTTSVSIMLTLVDAKGKPVSKITGDGSGKIPYPAFDYRLQEAADQALSEVQSKL